MNIIKFLYKPLVFLAMLGLLTAACSNENATADTLTDVHLPVVTASSGEMGDVTLTSIDILTRVQPMQAISGETARPRADMGAVSMQAAKNEMEPFQFVIQANDAPATVTAIEVTPLRAASGAEIDEITIYREHYVTVTHPSPHSPYPPQPYPDALIPLINPVTGQAVQGDVQYPALPIELAAGENQPIWVDVQIAKDAAAGEYTGTVIVSSANGATAVLPITLTVWNFTLPDRPELKTDFALSAHRVMEIYGRSDDTSSWSAADWQIIRSYYDLLLDAHLSPAFFLDAAPYPADDNAPIFDDSNPGLGTIAESMDYYINQQHASTFGYEFGQTGGILDTPSNSLDGWPFNDMLGENRAIAQAYMAEYAARCTQMLPDDRCITGDAAFWDEPNSVAGYQYVADWGQFMDEVEQNISGHSISYAVAEAPVTDNPAWPDLSNRVDLWVTPADQIWIMEEYSSENYASARIAAGDQVWVYADNAGFLPESVPNHIPRDQSRYNSDEHLGRWLDVDGRLLPGAPGQWGLDYYPISYRILPWLFEPYGIDGLLEWDTLYWDAGIDVWQTPGNYQMEENPAIYANGEGLYIYPGTMDRVGFNGPVPSMRLFWIRESVEDYAYIKLLREMGEDAFIAEQMTPFIRHIGDWDDNAIALNNARYNMGLFLSAENSGKVGRDKTACL